MTNKELAKELLYLEHEIEDKIILMGQYINDQPEKTQVLKLLNLAMNVVNEAHSWLKQP